MFDAIALNLFGSRTQNGGGKNNQFKEMAEEDSEESVVTRERLSEVTVNN